MFHLRVHACESTGRTSACQFLACLSALVTETVLAEASLLEKGLEIGGNSPCRLTQRGEESRACDCGKCLVCVNCGVNTLDVPMYVSCGVNRRGLGYCNGIHVSSSSFLAPDVFHIGCFLLLFLFFSPLSFKSSSTLGVTVHSRAGLLAKNIECP